MEDFNFEQEGTNINLVVACNAETPPLTEAMLISAFERSQYYETSLSHELLPSIVELGNEFIISVKEELEPEGDFVHQIAALRDGKLSIFLSADKMTAKATIEMAWGGKNIDLDNIKAECKKQGIVFGVKKSLVDRLLHQTIEADPGDLIEGTIALGLEPKHGKNAYFKPLIELLSEKIRRPMEIEGGKVDLKDLGDIETVKPGEKIYQKFPPTDGTPGKNLLGEELIPTAGKDAELEVSSGTTIDKKDTNILLAKREGFARLIENRMEVDDVYTLAELTPKHGHIKFNGSVMIAGDVSPEMRIVATGDVIIGGFVEQASIRCRGEITIISGASGKPLDEPYDGRISNCLLESGYRINVAFANQIDIIAKRDVHVHKQLSHCNVTAASLRVGRGKFADGKLIGGKILLSKGLVVGKLGSPSDTVTSVSLNRSFVLFKQKEIDIWTKVEPLSDELDALKNRLQSFLTDSQRAEIKELILEQQYKIDRLNSARKRITQKRKEYMNQVGVEITNTLHAAVTFEIGDKTIINDRERGPSIVKLDAYQIEIKPR